MPDPALAELSDDALIELLERGDADRALTEIERRYRERVRQYVHAIVRDEHLTDEATQEVFEKVFLKSHGYAPGTCFRAWLLEIARNQALSAQRARRRAPRPISSLGAPDDIDLLAGYCWCEDPREPEASELMAAFHAAVAELPERCREPFELCALQGLRYQQAAQALGIPVGTVAIRILRARQRLFEVLGPLLGRLRRPPACAQGAR